MIEYVIKLQIVGLQSKVLKVLRTGQNNINVNVSFLPKLVNFNSQMRQVNIFGPTGQVIIEDDVGTFRLPVTQYFR